MAIPVPQQLPPPTLPPPEEPPQEPTGRPWMVDPNDPASVTSAPGWTPMLGTIESGAPFGTSRYTGTEETERLGAEAGLDFSPAGIDASIAELGRRVGEGDFQAEGLIQTAIALRESYRKSGILGDGEGAGAAPPLLSQGEERMMIDLQNAIEVGKMDEGQAWKIIESYWSKEQTQTRRAEDATRRGETLLAGAHPGPNLPMTGPGGMGAGLQQKYGLPNLTPGVQGLQGSQALGVFGQAQQQLGLPPQLSPVEPPQFQLPNWQALGQGMPNFGGTNYMDQLLKEGRMTAPGL